MTTKRNINRTVAGYLTTAVQPCPGMYIRHKTLTFIFGF